MYKINTFFIFVLLIIISINPVKSQVSDDFSDFNLSHNPTWLGNDSFFQVNLNQELQSNALTGSSGEISLGLAFVKTADELEWRSNYRFGFNPSSQNHFKFYFYADSLSLWKSTNALFLQFGGSTGSTDSLMLIQISQSQRIVLARGRPSTLGKTNNLGSFCAQLDSSNLLRVLLDTSNTGNYLKEMELNVSMESLSYYSGYSFKYTSGNTKNFFADNFYLGPIKRDSMAPFVVKTFMPNAKQILVYFNERLDTNHTVRSIQLSGVSEPLNFTYLDDLKSILIHLNEEIEDSIFQIQMKGLRDMSANTILDTLLYCWFHEIKKQELIFSEVMFDPEPSKGLPNAEYIELYNRSEFPIYLNGFKITDGSSTALLPDILINPNDFILFCSNNDIDLFQSWNRYGLLNFPSLNNSGDNLRLIALNGDLIDQISYDQNWLQSLSFSDGGQSLSCIYPNQLCKGKAAWSLSTELVGGSPGAQCELWSEAYDKTAPELIRSVLISHTQILLIWNEACDLGKLKYKFGSDSLLAKCTWFSSSLDSFLFEWNPMLEKENRMFCLSEFKDCSGNTQIQTNHVFYMQVQPVAANEVLITEILFDTDEENEFIELFNRSEHLVQLKNMTLRRGSVQFKLPAYSLYPDSFVVLTKTHHDDFVNELIIPNFPTLYLSDSLFLFDENGYRIHEMYYNEDGYHDEFKKQQKSWSIEMIDNQNPCAEMDNWKACLGTKYKHSAGLINTVKNENPDRVPPRLVRMYAPSQHELHFYFSEGIDSLSLGGLTSSVWDKNRFFYHGNRQVLAYRTDSDLVFSTNYQLPISGLRDCVHHEMKDTLIEFSLPVYDSLALILNEVLFNPKPNAYDFIELYNRSENFIDLKNYFLASANEVGTNDKELLPIFENGYLMAPHSYLVLSAEDQCKFYPSLEESKQLITKIPAMPDEGIYLNLLGQQGQILESLHVNPELHFASIVDEEGVSLERLSEEIGIANNWTSGAAFCDFTSPGRKNCMSIKEQVLKETLSLNQEVLSPDADGFQDYLQINYEFESNDNSMTIFILDERGNKIKQLALSLRVGYAGILIWDGTNEQGIIPPEGIYLVRQEYYNTSGEYKIAQKPIVIARRERLN
ncbi:MAG: lamin tail domain-containing protein [Bacteroidia bacterium]